MSKTTDFIDYAATHQGDDCLIWPFGKQQDGYGSYGYRKPNGQRTTMSAHRAVLERVAGPPLAQGMQAAHAAGIGCDRACVNPRHLSWKTPQENGNDRFIDGTIEQKLTDDEVRAIRADTRLQDEIAAEHEISQPLVSLIKARKERANVPD